MEKFSVVYECLVRRIGALHSAFEGFHLHPCNGCGAPCFQEPCLVCGWYCNMSYPKYNVEQREARAHWRSGGPPHTKAERKFIEQVETAGNVAVWYVKYRIKTLEEVIRLANHSRVGGHSYTILGEWKAEALPTAEKMAGLPSAREIVQLVRAQAWKLRMAGELRRGAKIHDHNSNRVGEVIDNTFGPGELQSTFRQLTVQEDGGPQFKVIAPRTEEFLLTRW